MPLTPTLDLLATAARAGQGVGAFNVLLLETAEALVEGAERAGLPVVLQIRRTASPTTAGSSR